MNTERFETVLTQFGRLLILIAGVIALFSVKERLYLDSSYYFFHTLNEGIPRIDHDRFVLALAEMPILIGKWLGFGLDTIALLYSVGHVFIFLLLHSLVVKRYGQWRHGLLIGMMMFFGLSHLFFSPMLELWYGLILLVVFDARLMYFGRLKPPHLFWTAVLSLLILTAHPECFIPFLLILLLRWMSGELRRAEIITFVLLMVGVASFKFATFSPYESGAVSNSMSSSSTLLERATDTAAYARMIKMFGTHYFLICASALFGLLALWKAKKKEAFVCVLFILGFLFFIRITVGASTYGRYNQSVFLPFVFMSAYLFVMSLRYLSTKRMQWVAIGLLLIGSVRWVGETLSIRADMHERVAAIEEKIKEARAQNDRLIIPEIDDVKYPKKRSFSWSTGLESILFSSMDDGRTVSVVRVNDVSTNGNGRHLDADEVVLTPWMIRPIHEINDRYFKLKKADYPIEKKE